MAGIFIIFRAEFRIAMFADAFSARYRWVTGAGPEGE
jgi:hypothetical protein